MKKQFIIELDMVEGSVSFDNPDKLSYFEALGAIEYAKMLIANELINGEED